ncbi:MAG TPA: hypothetical protein VEU96_25210 [Bryobacteraceae bacterium]|nr:hypothetical protein [Bryobacteraceae bacterium]
MRAGIRVAIFGLAASLLALAQGPAPTVVFVCEHGSAKSVIAAAHFNRLAEEKGLPYRAVSRGIQPDEAIPEVVKSGLHADGLDVSSWKPKQVSDDDLRAASNVVTLACELPKPKAAPPEKLIEWKDVPAVGDGYAAARAAIVQQVEKLLQALAEKTPNEKKP